MSSGCGKRTQEDVGKLVESWRKMAGWTQETLAGYLGNFQLNNIGESVVNMSISLQVRRQNFFQSCQE